MIPKGTSHMFWVSVQRGAEAAGKEYGVDVIWNGPAQETEYARQIQIVDAMIAQRVDGIVLAATEKSALIPPVDRAAAAHIPVVVFDSGLDSQNYVSFVATDNYQAGRTAAQQLGKLLQGKGSAALIMNVPGSVSTMDRERGFEEALAQNFPGIRLVARQFSLSDRAKGRAVTENILSAHPELSGLFASAEPGSIGAALAIKSRGLAGKVRFVGFDANEEMIEDVRGGVFDALLVQDPYGMGFEAVKTLISKLNGVTPPKRVDLRARVVTKANLDRPEIQALLKGKR